MWLVVILVLASLLRLIFLDKIPTSVTGDELTYILTAKSFLLTGKDIGGVITPWQVLLFQSSPLSMPQAELPYFLLMPFLAGGLSLFAVRLPFALLGIILVWLIYQVTKELFDRKTALIAAFFVSISPWLIYINRTAYEMTPALVFYLLGLYVLLKTKGWKILFAFPIFILAFYSYIATKVIFFPFLLIAVAYVYLIKNNKKFGKQYLSLLALSFSFVLIFIGLLQASGTSRLGDILLPNSPAVVEQVDNIRKLSIHSPLSSVFINKFVVYFQTLIIRFVNAFSASYLFLYGDNFFGMWKHGLMYVLDALFLFFGAAILLFKKKSLFYFLIGTILIGFIPQIIHKGTDNFTPHITFIFPFILMLTAYGAVSLADLFSKQQKLILTGIIFVYLLLMANFMQIYFYQYPIQGQSDIAMRELSRYVALAQDGGQKVVVYSKTSNDLLRKHIFYANLYNKDTAVSLRSQLYAKEPYVFNVTFKECSDTFDPAKVTDTIIVSRTCSDLFRNTNHLTIAQLTDGGGIYSIYNDKLCAGFVSSRYISGLQIADFALEKLSKKQLCEKFITLLR